MSLVKHNQRQTGIQSRLKPNLAKASTDDLLALQEEINAEIEERIEAESNQNLPQTHEHYHFYDDRGRGEYLSVICAMIMTFVATTVYVGMLNLSSQTRVIQYSPYPITQQ